MIIKGSDRFPCSSEADPMMVLDRQQLLEAFPSSIAELRDEMICGNEMGQMATNKGPVR